MTSKSTKEFMEALGKADPLIDVENQLDQVIASLRVVWLALQSKEWLDNLHIDHCADCLDRAVTALDAPRAVVSAMALDIQNRARAGLEV